MMFLIAQARTGSTLLSRALNTVPGLVCYLEPLHQWLPRLLDRPAFTPFLAVDRDELVRRYDLARRSMRLWPRRATEHRPIVDYLKLLADGSGDDVPVFQFNRLWGRRLSLVLEEFPDARLHFHYREDVDAQFASYNRMFRRPDFFGEIDTWLRRSDAEVQRLEGRAQFERVRQACIDDVSPNAELVTTYEELLADPEDTFADMLSRFELSTHAKRLAALVEDRHG
jgi:hypothetical protein